MITRCPTIAFRFGVTLFVNIFSAAVAAATAGPRWWCGFQEIALIFVGSGPKTFRFRLGNCTVCFPLTCRSVLKIFYEQIIYVIVDDGVWSCDRRSRSRCTAVRNRSATMRLKRKFRSNVIVSYANLTKPNIKYSYSEWDGIFLKFFVNITSSSSYSHHFRRLSLRFV